MKSTITALVMVIGLQSAGFAETDPATLQALRRIDAPRVVGVPPENACRGLMVMPDGEIRHYGSRHDPGSKRGPGRPVYISSRDGGLSWREIPVDPVVSRFAQHVLRLDAKGRINDVPCVEPDTWADLEVRWDKDQARFRTGDGAWHELPRVFPTRNGISYLHLQSAASEADPAGVLVESVAAAAAE